MKAGFHGFNMIYFLNHFHDYLDYLILLRNEKFSVNIL